MSSKLSSVVERMENIEKAVQELAKMGPVAAGALRGAAVGAITGGVKGAMTGGAAKSEDEEMPKKKKKNKLKKTLARLDDLAKAIENLSKPPVSEAQRRAMHAAASGNSTLGIPASVGKEFADADEGGKLPEKKKKDKAKKADDPTNGKQHFEEKFYPGQADLEHGKDDANNQDNAPGADKPKKDKEATLNADSDGKLEKRPDTASKAATEPDDGKGTTLDETVRKAVTDPTSPYYKRPKADESNAPTITYGPGGSVTHSGAPKKPSTMTESQRQASGAHAQTAMRERRTAAAGGKPQYEAQQAQRARVTQQQTYERRKMAKSVRELMFNAGQMPVLKKACEAFVGDELCKATKDELFPEKGAEPMKLSAMPMDKEQAANEVYWQVKRLCELRNEAYAVDMRHPQAKKAFEYLYDCEKAKLRDRIRKFEGAKELQKSEEEVDAFNRLDAKALTHSLRKNHSDAKIELMIKAAVDTGRVHRNVLLEWQNFKTVNPAILAVYEDE